ncbi:MAG TPA: hypothetical protein VGN97_00635 [Mesorhizobium sp.]|nr:hypothetical protein [Mesorhizobium sp.]
MAEPASTSIDFVQSLKESPAWVEAELRAKGLIGPWTISGDQLYTNEMEVLRYVNRMRAFSQLDGSLERPWFVLPLVDANGQTGVCVTLHPRDVVPSLGMLDFRKDSFTVPDLAAENVRGCLADRASGQQWEALDRQAFQARYFKEKGFLNRETALGFGENPDFILRAFDLGFFPFRDSSSGQFRIQ